MDEQARPLLGVDYPGNFQEFEAWFATEVDCRNYLARLRWPSGFCCPQCGSRDAPWLTGRSGLRCKGCRSDISLTGGTLFEGTRKPLQDWYHAMWFVTSQKHGASALGLQRVLELLDREGFLRMSQVLNFGQSSPYPKKGASPSPLHGMHHLRTVPGVGAGGSCRVSVTHEACVHGSDLQGFRVHPTKRRPMRASIGSVPKEDCQNS